MKISSLIKKLQAAKKKHGDLRVLFDETSINEEACTEYSQHDIAVKGAFLVPWEESSQIKKALVLEGAPNRSNDEYGNDPL